MKKKKECVIANEVEQFQMRKGLLRHDVPRNDLCKKNAFTLAEVLITLGIIGIVAALTIPALMQSTNNKELVSGTLKMGTVLSNALKGMEALDMVGVDKLADLDTFAEKFKKQLKTTNCTTHSVCLADGGYFDYVNPQFGGHCDKDTPCVEIVADINGKKGHGVGGKDVFKFLVTNRGIVPAGETTTCTGLDCTSYVLANHKLWEGSLTSPEEPVINVNQGDSCDNEDSKSGDLFCVNGVWMNLDMGATLGGYGTCESNNDMHPAPCSRCIDNQWVEINNCHASKQGDSYY